MVEPLKQDIDRMTSIGVIRKLNINEATDWCHILVLVWKPNGKLWVCLNPRTINKALRFNVHNARAFQDMTSSIRRVAKVSKIDANSGFWTWPMDENSQILTNFNTPLGEILLYNKDAIQIEPGAIFLSVLHGLPFPRHQFNTQCYSAWQCHDSWRKWPTAWQASSSSP